MINKRRLINTFKKLVKIDSLSLKERKVMKFLQKELKGMGYKSKLVGGVRDGEVGNLMVEIGGHGPRLLLNAHVDTVAPGENIRPIERKGMIYSNGSTILGADNKAGVAAILEIIRSLKENKIKYPSLQIIFTVAEETGLLGAKALPEKMLKADFGIVLDGGDINEIIYKAPTQYNLTATIFGKAAHAGIHPEEGINAIQVASIAIAKMRLGRIDQETTANIGVIKGGRATNIIPDEVELKGEARSHNPLKLKSQIKHMERILSQTCKKFNARLALRVERMYKSFEMKKSSRIIQLALAVMEEAREKPVIKQTGGGSDANIFNEMGINTIIMGVGADRVHTTAERIAVNDFVKGTEIILNLIRRIAL